MKSDPARLAGEPGWEDCNRSLALLAHPVSLGALALLLLNDHLLRRFWPSWLTGKLGDIAWLVFAPLALAAFWTLLLHVVRARKLQRFVYPAAFLFTGLLFTLVKTVPGVHAGFTGGLAWLLGAPPALVRDPSDLLALPALGLAAGLWFTTRYRPALPTRSAYGLVALPLAALLTLANAGIPDPGIQCFTRKPNGLYANAGFASYRTSDGGISWGFEPGGRQGGCEYRDPTTWVEAEGPQPGTRYRYRANQEIQLSTDGGQTWNTAYSIVPASEAERQYYLRRRPGNTVFQPGPLDAIADPRSGNMLFAMGHQGILVHTASGDWTWSMGGEYQHLTVFPSADAFSLLLGGMLLLAFGAVLLVFASLALRWTAKPLRIIALVFGWIAFLLITLLFPPVITNGYTQVATTLGMIGGAAMILPLSLEQSFRLAKIVPTVFPRLILFGLGAGVLFFLPYVLWLYNALPSLYLATGFALALVLAVLAAGIVNIRRLRIP